ncbi:uncharacterized protein [Phyllobates terribilis]|uniref:uncharacterized protein n=1 Tax=Phyllobates terribilis TaxID=111132 RepID=UPI003CCB353A
MSMIGELDFFLGLHVVQKAEGIQIHQHKYLREIIKKFGMDNIKLFHTPVSKANETLYRGRVGSLMYLTASSPDIVFAVSLCARFQYDPRESHVTIIKCILRYLKGTDNLCLWYPKNCDFTLVGYTDADYAGYLVDRKSTSGMSQFLGPCLISWGSRKQNSVAVSTSRRKYIAVTSCCAQLLWLKKQLTDFGISMG